MTRFDGADISHHQDDAGPIDWPTLRANSWWIATKATQGTWYTDPTFAAHWREMKIGFTHRNAYHWLSPNVNPIDQANKFLSVWDRTAGAMLDAEEAGITQALALSWCETVEEVTHRPCSVYTGAYVAGGTIWQSTAMRHSKYGRRPMHLAAYTTEAKALLLPGVKAYPWSAWQYSSNGPVPGVVGRCDMNRIDIREHYDLACGVTPLPPLGDDVIDIVRDAETNLDKFAVMPDGTLRPLSGVELKARSIANSIDLGYPLTKAERDALGYYYAPAPGGPTQFTGTGTAEIKWSGTAS